MSSGGGEGVDGVERLERVPALRQSVDHAAAGRDPIGARALPGRDVPQSAERVQPQAGWPVSLPAGQA